MFYIIRRRRKEGRVYMNKVKEEGRSMVFFKVGGDRVRVVIFEVFGGGGVGS